MAEHLQGYEGSLLKVTNKNGKNTYVSIAAYYVSYLPPILTNQFNSFYGRTRHRLVDDRSRRPNLDGFFQ